ncbi:Pantothenate transporter FEN2 [Vanrija pseudolonga]|uniref:Pantothenate transporter FEN2 n=1 Tax=Vanrija pseudolonga TaxID=143232 RepID=A0AAF1BPQ7_9TREE|nr:Pantothenate transporter FEN2 [Vanrija pseudolonga]
MGRDTPPPRDNDTDSASSAPKARSRWPFGALSAERRLVLKLDLSMLVFSLLGLIMRYIDQANISTAFVSGMKEQLGMFGLEYNYVLTAWTVGYCIGQIPGTVLLNRVSPHYVIFACEAGWSLMTLCTTWVTNWKQLLFIRFMVGLFEAPYYPGILFLLGNWYTPSELGKRTTLFQGITSIGVLINSLMQAGIHRTLNGKLGRPGWRWIFIIDAVISLPVAIAAFFFIPDLPWHIKPNWLIKQEDIDLAKKRLDGLGRKGTSPDGLKPRALWNVLKSWHIWLFTLTYILYMFNMQPQNSFAFWLKNSKDPKYTIEQINYYPCGMYAVQFVSCVVLSYISDTWLRGARWPFMVLTGLWHCVDCALLAAWDPYGTHRGRRWALYYLTGLVNCTPGLLYAWCSEIISESAEKRAIVMGTFNSVAFSFTAWLPLIFFKQTDQPWVRNGNIACAAFIAAEVATIFGILFLSKRDEARKARLVDNSEGEGDDSVPRLTRTGYEDSEDWDGKK